MIEGNEWSTPDSCVICGGTGIMYLESGLERLKAPCIECSADQRLEDLEEALRRSREWDLLLEKAAIREHNERLALAEGRSSTEVSRG